MKFLDRLKCTFSNNSWDRMIRDFLSGNDLTTGGDVNASGNNALKFSAVFACCRILAETFASVPLFEYRKAPNGDGDRDRTDDTGLYDILHNVFNAEMNAYTAKEMAMYQLNLGGNAVFERQFNRFGDLVGLYPYQWDAVEIARNQDTRQLQYKIHSDSGGDRVLRRDQVLHIAGPSLNGIAGMSPIEYAHQAIALGMTYEGFSRNFFKNGAFPSGTLQMDGHMSPEAFTRFKADFKTAYTAMLNKGTPMFLEDGVKYNPVTMKMSDAELLASKKFQIEDIGRIYRVPLHLLQHLDKATFSNIEHQSLEFVMFSMLPWFKRWEESINAQLLTRQQREQGYYIEGNLAALLRGDQKSMAEAFSIGRQWGWLSVNDIRRLLNMNSIENGDIYVQPMNMIEAGAQVDDQTKAIVDEVHSLIEIAKERKNG